MSVSSKLSASAREELLRTAGEACFLTGVGDLAEELGGRNMAFGLAKIRFVQERLGITPDACFVGAPDATITRNIGRWQAGFGYGGRIRYAGDFAVLDVKSNCCGHSLAGLSRLPDPEELLGRVHDASCGRLPGLPPSMSWDFGQSNHFISVVEFDSPVAGYPYGVFVHGSGPELRGPGAHGPGLYYDRSPRLGELLTRMTTPWGPLHVLTDKDAVAEYWQGYRQAEKASIDRRRVLTRALLPEAVELFNLAHQGARAPNDYHLGCVVDTGTLPVPVGLRADLPIFVFRMHDNLTDEAVAALGFGERAARLGLTRYLRTANVLPHGGGYRVPGYRRVVRVVTRGEARIYELDVDGRGRAYHSCLRHVPFDYRGEEVVARAEELGLGELLARGRALHQFMV